MQVKCTSCGASQNIIDAQNCSYCGNLIEIENAKNNYQSSLKSETGNLMAMAETAMEATNWDEALQYFNRVLEKEIANSDAWLGKGISIVYTSKIGDLKINEAIAYWKNSLKHSPNHEAMGKRVAKEINEVVNKFYPFLENHFIEFKDLDNSYQELVTKFATLERAQDYATQLDSSNINLCETGCALCKRVIQIPKQYAIADEGAAWAQGITGALQQNKYKQQDAIQTRRKAVARKAEIENVSRIVIDLELKYIDKIKKINPESKIIQTSVIITENDEHTIEFVTSKYRSTKSLILTASEVKKKYNLKLNAAESLVNKILLSHNLITQKEINKNNFLVYAITIVIVVFLVLLVFIFSK